MFHPTFNSGKSERSWNIVDAEFDDVFELLSKHIVPDMKDYALTEDASDIIE